MAGRKFGTRRYFCVDCNHKQFEPARAMVRRTRPRCTFCGSTFLEPDTDGADEAWKTIGTLKEAGHIALQTDRTRLPERPVV